MSFGVDSAKLNLLVRLKKFVRSRYRRSCYPVRKVSAQSKALPSNHFSGADLCTDPAAVRLRSKRHINVRHTPFFHSAIYDHETVKTAILVRVKRPGPHYTANARSVSMRCEGGTRALSAVQHPGERRVFKTCVHSATWTASSNTS